MAAHGPGLSCRNNAAMNRTAPRRPASNLLADLLITLSVFMGGTADAQLGLAGSSYAGLWDLERQPAAISYSQHAMEFNLVKLGAGADNDFMHMKGVRFGSFGLDNLQLNGDLSADAASTRGTRALDVDSRVLGPSAMMRFGNTSIALTTALRARMDVTNIEGLLRLLGDDALNLTFQENTRLGILRFGSRQLAWGEAGITVAQRFDMSHRVRLHAAATGKLLLGMHGAYIQNDAPTLTLNLQTQELKDVNIAYGLSDFEAISRGKFIQGTGVGVDVGIVLEVLREGRSEKEEAGHLLRFGAAITDLGAISFGGKARTNAITNGRATWQGFASLRIDDVASVDTALSHLLLGDAHASDRQQGLRMALPTALRTSIDWNIHGKFFLHAAGTFGMDRGLASVREPDMLCLAPRFGNRTYEVAMPVSLYRMKEPRVGLNMRVGGFMLGSDKVGALLGLTDLGGMDVYVGVRVAIK